MDLVKSEYVSRAWGLVGTGSSGFSKNTDTAEGNALLHPTVVEDPSSGRIA
jgi:hypothetical protein